MFPLTIFGSTNCLVILIIISNTIIDIPSGKSPFSPDIIAHGIITVPEPKIGSASTNPIPNAISNGNPTFRPAKYIIYSPIKEITKDI